MEISNFPFGVPAFNLFSNKKIQMLNFPAADLLKCGSCCTEFLLSDIVLFIQHKLYYCKQDYPNLQQTNSGLSNGHKSNSSFKCSTCPQIFQTALSLLEHAQFIHKINIFIEDSSHHHHLNNLGSSHQHHQKPMNVNLLQQQPLNPSEFLFNILSAGGACVPGVINNEKPCAGLNNSMGSASSPSPSNSSSASTSSTSLSSSKAFHKNLKPTGYRPEQAYHDTILEQSIVQPPDTPGSSQHQYNQNDNTSYSFISSPNGSNEPGNFEDQQIDDCNTMYGENGTGFSGYNSYDFANAIILAKGPITPSSGDETSKQPQIRKVKKDTFHCDICYAQFNQKIHLTKHTAKHTGIKPFKCTECSYSTVERSHLKVHVRVHTGEKPFKCNFCDYATAQSSTLKIHKRRHHTDVENVAQVKFDKTTSNNNAIESTNTFSKFIYSRKPQKRIRVNQHEQSKQVKVTRTTPDLTAQIQANTDTIMISNASLSSNQSEHEFQVELSQIKKETRTDSDDDSNMVEEVVGEDEDEEGEGEEEEGEKSKLTLSQQDATNKLLGLANIALERETN